jgi:LuxR family maltose regulon positive regulatory protein
VLQALALDQQGETEHAAQALVRALGLAGSEGYIRVFVDEGGPIIRLLRRLRELRENGDGDGRSEIGIDTIDKLLGALGVSSRGEWEATRRNGTEPSSHMVAPSGTLLTPVSEREIEVLQLIAEGKTNASIADQLYISLSTVKTHINNLYSKLGVESRTQALARAKEFHLL